MKRPRFLSISDRFVEDFCKEIKVDSIPEVYFGEFQDYRLMTPIIDEKFDLLNELSAAMEVDDEDNITLALDEMFFSSSSKVSDQTHATDDSNPQFVSNHDQSDQSRLPSISPFHVLNPTKTTMMNSSCATPIPFLLSIGEITDTETNNVLRNEFQQAQSPPDFLIKSLPKKNWRPKKKPTRPGKPKKSYGYKNCCLRLREFLYSKNREGLHPKSEDHFQDFRDGIIKAKKAKPHKDGRPPEEGPTRMSQERKNYHKNHYEKERTYKFFISAVTKAWDKGEAANLRFQMFETLWPKNLK